MEEIKEFLINFVEKESDVFSGFPVCPFAKKERIEKKIKFVETKFENIDVKHVLDEVQDFLLKDYSTLLLISDKDVSIEQTRHFFRCITTLMENNGANVFLFHKDDNRSYGGIYTRRSPVPFIMVGYKNQIAKKKAKLLKTKYYDKLVREEMFNLHPKRKKKWQKLKK